MWFKCTTTNNIKKNDEKFLTRVDALNILLMLSITHSLVSQQWKSNGGKIHFHHWYSHIITSTSLPIVLTMFFFFVLLKWEYNIICSIYDVCMYVCCIPYIECIINRNNRKTHHTTAIDHSCDALGLTSLVAIAEI